MEVLALPIGELVFDPSNARKHSPKNLDAIKGSLLKFGQQKPIVIDKNNIVIAGNGTLEAAKSLGWETINVVKTDLDGSNATAFAIADNRTGELAEWNDDALKRTLEALNAEGFALDAIGFTDEDLAQWVKPAEVIAGCDEDEVPEHVEPKTKPGDLYQLGDHRLLCGDSTNIQHVERLMDGKKADMVFTDPPYGIDVVGSDGNIGGGTRNAPTTKFKKIIGDDKEFECMFLLALADKTILFGGNYFAHALPKSGRWMVWQKKPFDADRTLSDCELIWTNLPGVMVKSYQHVWDGYFRSGTKKDELNTRVHPTQKPVALLERMLNDLGEHNVLDPFLGSGSTLIACEKTKRKCYGMEIDPHYCDVIVARWEKYTGKTASLVS